MVIREASDMLVHGISNSFNFVQFSEVEIILASVILRQRSRFNDCSPVQLIDIASICYLITISHKFNDCSPVQWVDMDMMLTSVIWWHSTRFNDSSLVQLVV
jgi:hypothetical protein